MHRVNNAAKPVEQLILVDSDDREIGHLGKSECHDGTGVLHRAFSLFLFNDDGEMLLQRRSEGKRLWPGFWSNSCCRHPRQGESMYAATARRLVDELNTSAALEFVYKFEYQARYGDEGSENELCWVYLGHLGAEAKANEAEISALRFISAGDLQREIDRHAERFTPWFRMEWQRLNEEYAAQLAQYTAPR